MSTFAERHPKSPSDGRFTRRALTPPDDSVELGGFEAHEIFREWSDGWLPTVTPASPAQLREAFEEATVHDHQSQIIKVAHSMAWITEPIDGGHWGSPALVHVLANTGPLVFRSGYAVVYVNAERLCEIDATDHAVVEVTVASARSAVITVRDHASVRVTAGDSARGGLHVRDRAAHGELRGDATEFYFSDVRHQGSKR